MNKFQNLTDDELYNYPISKIKDEQEFDELLAENRRRDIIRVNAANKAE